MGTFEAYGSTVINGTGDSYREIAWSDWNALTPEQQQAIPKAVITDVPGVNGKISTEFLKTLWVNPSPNSAFAAQNITLASDDYDFLLIIYRLYTTVNSYQSVITKKGQGTILDLATLSDYGATTRARAVNYSSDTSLSVMDCSAQQGSNIYATDNHANVPAIIYGFKKSIEFDLTAVIANVSTDASRCMLSNGKSVENALSVESLTSQYATTGLVSCLKYGKLIQAVLEFTPSAITHGTVLIAKLPATLVPCYLSLGMSNGQSLTCLLSNVSGQSYANIIAYYPGSVTASRVDATIQYLTT